MKRTLTSAFLSVASGNLFVLLAALFTTPIIVRLLGEHSYGQYATVMALFGLLMILVSSGVNSGTRKYISEDRDEEQWKSHVFGFYFRLAALFAFLGSAALLAAAQIGIVDRTLGEEFARYVYLLALLVFTSQFGEYTRRTLMGLQLEHISEPINVLYKLSFAVFAILLAYLGYGVVGVLLGHVLARLLVIVTSMYFITKHVSVSAILTTTPEWFPREKLLNFNHLSVLYVFLLSSLYHVDVLMLEMYTTSAQVGYYKIALVIAEFLWFVPRAVQSVMIQSTSDLWAQGKTERVTEISTNVTRFTFVFTVLLAIGLAVLAEDFVPLYAGSAYTASVVPLLLLLPGAVGFAIARPVLAISHAKGDLRVMIYATGLSAGMNVVLNATLIPLYGIEGAAIATSIGYGSLPVFHVLGARRLGYRPLSDLRIVPVAVTATVTGLCIYPLAAAIDGVLLSLLVVPPVGFVVYSIVTVLTGAVTRTEVFDVLSDLPPPISRRAATVERMLDEREFPFPR